MARRIISIRWKQTRFLPLQKRPHLSLMQAVPLLPSHGITGNGHVPSPLPIRVLRLALNQCPCNYCLDKLFAKEWPDITIPTVNKVAIKFGLQFFSEGHEFFIFCLFGSIAMFIDVSFF